MATHDAPAWPGTASMATAADRATSGAPQSAALPSPSTDHAGGVAAATTGEATGASAAATAGHPSPRAAAIPTVATARERNLHDGDSTARP